MLVFNIHDFRYPFIDKKKKSLEIDIPNRE